MQKQKWNEEFLRELDTGEYPKYPNEVMLKLVFGSYLEKPLAPQKNWKVLDVGCAFGSNLIPFADMGCEVYGIDIHSEITKNAEKVMNARGYNKVEFREGSNRSIPYPDDFFDLILSVNTLHYESSEVEGDVERKIDAEIQKSPSLKAEFARLSVAKTTARTEVFLQRMFEAEILPQLQEMEGIVQDPLRLRKPSNVEDQDL